MKLVTIITPTIPSRRKLLLEQCIASVKEQTYREIEHVIVQDGPSPEGVPDPEGVRFVTLGRNWRAFLENNSVGGVARYVGCALARGEYIAYLDDDDRYMPFHVEKLVNLLEDKGADFVFSKMNQMKEDKLVEVIGNGKVAPGKIGTPMVLHKVECLKIGSWKPMKSFEDYTLFRQWDEAKLKHAFLDEVTVTVRIGPNYKERA